MKKNERIAANIMADKSLTKEIGKLRYYDTEQFIKDGEKYISAVRSGRMFCVIHSVSSSGMNRNMSFHSCEKHSRERDRFSYRQYSCLFLSLGYTESRAYNGAFMIGGCGMDMVFATNYNIIRSLYRLGFITLKECCELEQMTPTYF